MKLIIGRNTLLKRVSKGKSAVKKARLALENKIEARRKAIESDPEGHETARAKRVARFLSNNGN